MRQRGLPSRVAAIAAPVFVAGLLTAPLPANAQASPTGGIVVAGGSSLAESAIASCAGGAAIGYLVVLGTGVGAPVETSALFCGLSVAASVASSVAVEAWRSTARLMH